MSEFHPSFKQGNSVQMFWKLETIIWVQICWKHELESESPILRTISRAHGKWKLSIYWKAGV